MNTNCICKEQSYLNKHGHNNVERPTESKYTCKHGFCLCRYGSEAKLEPVEGSG